MLGRWHPKYIVRSIDARQSSANVVIVETDIGQGFLKAIGNPAGTHSLASELVGTQLAELIELQMKSKNSYLDQSIIRTI